MLLTITESAKQHLKSIINYQSKEMQVRLINLKIKASHNPNNKQGIELSYCLPGEEEPSDISINLEDFILYVDKSSEEALLDAVIDYRLDDIIDNDNLDQNANNQKSHKNNNNSGRLHIKAPFLYKHSSATNAIDPNLNPNSDFGTKNTKYSLLFNEINQFIIQEINPWLARHNGMVKLIDINEDESQEGVSISLEFGGGCKGCSMVNFTLKRGIEKNLKNKFKQIVLIKDITDHVTGKNPYYL